MLTYVVRGYARTSLELMTYVHRRLERWWIWMNEMDGKTMVFWTFFERQLIWCWKKVRLRRRQVLTTCRKITEDGDFFTPPDNNHIFFNVYINLEPLSYENRLLGCKNTNLFAYKGIFWGFSSKKSHNLTVIQRCWVVIELIFLFSLQSLPSIHLN